MESDQGRPEGGLAPETNDAMALLAKIKLLLAEQDAPVIGAVLAQLTALFVVAHVPESPSPYKTRLLRNQVLEQHVAMVKAAIPVTAMMVREQTEAAIHGAQPRQN